MWIPVVMLAWVNLHGGCWWSQRLMLRMLALWVLRAYRWPTSRCDHVSAVAILAPIHLITFFFAAMVCHGELASGAPMVAT